MKADQRFTETSPMTTRMEYSTRPISVGDRTISQGQLTKPASLKMMKKMVSKSKKGPILSLKVRVLF